MFGKVAHYSKATSRGKIDLIDGNIVHFTLDDWNLNGFPKIGMEIDYIRGYISEAKVKTFTPELKIITHSPTKQIDKESLCPDLVEYFNRKVDSGYEIISKDEKSFVLKQQFINTKIYLRAQRWIAYALPFIVTLFLYSEYTNIPMDLLPSILAISILSFLGTISTLIYQSHKSERVQVQLFGQCNMSKFIVDDSQEIAYYQ